MRRIRRGGRWHTMPNWPPHATGDEMVAAMAKVGVDGAIFISAFGLYRYDASYAVEVQRAHPDQFAIVKPVDPDDPAVDEVIAEWKKTPGTVGIRINADQGAGTPPRPEPSGPRPHRPIGGKHDFPVNLLCWGNLDAGTALIDRHPDTRFIIDHLGILQPRTPPAPPQPWADLPKVLELAKRKNAVIKVSGACTLSQKPYPFPASGTRCARVRRLGSRPLPVGHRLDARLRGGQLRAGGRAVSQDRSFDRQRAGDADARRDCQGLSLGAEESDKHPKVPDGANCRPLRCSKSDSAGRTGDSSKHCYSTSNTHQFRTSCCQRILKRICARRLNTLVRRTSTRCGLRLGSRANAQPRSPKQLQQKT